MVAPFPLDRLPRIARGSLAITNAAARWLAVRPAGRSVATLVGGEVALSIGSAPLDDPNAATCEVRVGGHAIEVRGASGFVRWFAQRMLAGPDELNAPRALNEIEQAMWVLFVATAVEDLGIAGQVWQIEEPRAAPTASARPRSTTATEFGSRVNTAASGSGSGSGSASGSVSGTGSVSGAGSVRASEQSPIVVEARLGASSCTIELRFPPELVVAAPPTRVPAWADAVMLEAPFVVGRCLLQREDLARLRPRSVVTLDRSIGQVELVVLGGSLGLRVDPRDPLVARVATEYVPRAMALPEDARVELTVGVGTARMSLRQVMGLAVGEVVPLGRPLAGPFEVRAAGTLIGQGELVDVDGELGVRIVSLAQE